MKIIMVIEVNENNASCFFLKNRAATFIIYTQEFFINFAQTMFLTEQPRIKFQWDTLNSGLMRGDGIYHLCLKK